MPGRRRAPRSTLTILRNGRRAAHAAHAVPMDAQVHEMAGGRTERLHGCCTQSHAQAAPWLM